MKIQTVTWSLCAASLAVLVACGGGSGGGDMPSTNPSNNSGGGVAISGASPGATSSGAITAFGSVFINGHEFDISKASVIDDDTGASISDTSGLEVGQVLDVKVASTSSSMAPAAQALHLHPLVRGYVDAADSGSITVMGQTVQLSSTTVFSDHRACVSASSSPCAAVDGVNDLGLTTGSGGSAIPGSYVVVDGYLFNGGASVNVIASLVAVFDAPGASPGMAAFKAEGSVTAVSGSTLTIGGLSVNLASAKCYAAGASAPCASSFSVGQVVSAVSATAPALPATSFNASAALLRDRLPVTTAGATIELQGGVSAVSGSSFTLRGVTVDASALPAGTAMPVTGDIVRVLGTVGSTGATVTATSVQILRAAASASYAFQGDITQVTAGSAANTFSFQMLGQTISVNSQTQLTDFSTRNWPGGHMTTNGNAFNISTFQTYLGASDAHHAIVRTAADANGNLQALSVTLLKASSVSGVAGVVDASPAPANSTVTGTPSTFSIHGVPVSADPHAIQLQHKVTAISVGDEVVAVGSYSGGKLSVSATRSLGNYVIDGGPPRQADCPGF